MEIGLIDENQTLYRKRQRGGKKHRPASSDSDNDSSDGGELEMEPPEPSEPEPSSSSSSSSSSNDEEEGGAGDAGPDAADLPNTGPVGKYIKQLTDKGLSEQVAWIQNCLRTTAEDREEEGKLYYCSD